MIPEEIVVKFAHVLDNFEPIDIQPSNNVLTRLQEAIAPLLLQIMYDKTGAVHNLIGLIRPETAYVACYGKAFPDPTRVGAYNSNIDKDDTAVIRGGPQGKARWLRHFRNGETGYDTIRARCRRRHLGQWITGQRLPPHQGRTQGTICTPTGGLHRPARPQRLGAA